MEEYILRIIKLYFNTYIGIIERQVKVRRKLDNRNI